MLKICKTSYTELFETGEIQSVAVGEKIIVNIKSNMCGDILICISPKKGYYSKVTDILNLISTDNQIEQQKKIAIKTLEQKHEALLILPILISSLVNALFLFISFLITSNSIYNLYNRNFNIEMIIDFWPWIVPLLTIIFRKSIGFKIISFLT